MENVNSTLRSMTLEQLMTKLDEARRDLLELRLKAATTHVASFSTDKRKLKRAVAQALTHVRLKQMETFEQ